MEDVPLESRPMFAFMRASTHPLNSGSFSALKIWTFCGVNVTAREVPGAGGTTLKINFPPPVRLILRCGWAGGKGVSVGDVVVLGDETAVTHR